MNMQKFRLTGLREPEVRWEFARYKFAINCKFIRFLGKAPQTPRSLWRFAHKTSKNRRLGGFYLTNCLAASAARMPDNSGFYGFFAKKGRKNLQVQSDTKCPRLLTVLLLTAKNTKCTKRKTTAKDMKGGKKRSDKNLRVREP
jgi:hypothetical protein